MELLLDYIICGQAQAIDGQFMGKHFINVKERFRALPEQFETSLVGIVEVDSIRCRSVDFDLLNENLMEPSINIEVTIRTTNACGDAGAVSQKLNEAVAAMLSEFEDNLHVEADAELMRFADMSPDGVPCMGDDMLIKAISEMNKNVAIGDSDRFMKPITQWLNGSGHGELAKMAKVYTS